MKFPARWICKLTGHRLDGPETDGRLLCSRCGNVFNARLLRAFDAMLRERGERGILP